CSRDGVYPLLTGHRCYFHLADQLRSGMDRTFDEAFEMLIRAQDGHWAGFQFPKNVTLRDKVIDFGINASWATFGRLTIQRVRFLKEVTFWNCEFQDRTVLNCSFQGGVNFDDAIFHDAVSFRGHRTI